MADSASTPNQPKRRGRPPGSGKKKLTSSANTGGSATPDSETTSPTPLTPPVIPPSPPKAIDPADKPLSPQEQIFVASYLCDWNATRAYLVVHPNASYGAAAVSACEWLKRPHVKREVESGKDAIVKRFRIRQNEVTQEILRVAYADIFYLFDDNDQLLPARKVPMGTRRALAGYDVTENTVTTGVGARRRVVCEKRHKIRFHDKLAALDKLCGLLGMKTVSLPPIELLLSLLPPEIGTQLRSMLMPPPNPILNGNGAH